MDYLQIQIKCDEHLKEILTASLYGISYDAFEETTNGIDAYIDASLFNQKELDDLLESLQSQDKSIISYDVNKLKNKNWNEEWEKNFSPVNVDEKVYIRATFHEAKPNFPFEIVIDPKMSFGTGHHATTSLMIRHLLANEISQKDLLDVGTGTGILAIMAHKLNASHIEATDIDDWCIENSRENFELNDIYHINTKKGDIASLTFDRTFDIILANINKNVLLTEIEYYSKLLSTEGLLLLSGFYEHDAQDLIKKCEEFHLTKTGFDSENKWACIILKKIA